VVGWWRGASLRARLILIGSAGVAAGLALGGLVLVATLSYTLQRDLDQNAAQTAADVATLVDAGRLPDPIPGAGSAVIQVVGPGGAIVAASAEADRLVPMVPAGTLRSAGSGDRFTVGSDRVGLDDPVRVASERVRVGESTWTVLVAVSGRGVEDSVRIVRTVLLVAFPVLVTVLALLAWRVVGWTLRPVEQLRRGAAEITGARTDDRLPVPTGNDEVHRLAVTLNDMLARLDAARRRQREFVADAAHELRSPLASMRLQTEVADRLGTATDWRETAAGLLADLDRLSRLTDDLLLLARADDADDVRPGRPAERIDLTGLAREVVGRYGDARVPVAAGGADPQWVAGSRDALDRIAANLLDNACRHASTTVVVDVRAEVGAGGDPGRTGAVGQVLLTVTDDGPGIPEADRSRVFDRFTRLDDARARDDGGSGLGLAIVRELVRLHGGQVRLTDASPGVRAEVRLPAADPGADPSADPDTSADAGAGSGGEGVTRDGAIRSAQGNGDVSVRSG
jgi:signal transduction histidine kinase